MIETAKKIGLEAIVEVHGVEDGAYFQDAEIIGVNQRNLSDFSMHPQIHETWISRIPAKVVSLAASGVLSPEDAERIFALGYEAILVGEALTRSEDPLSLLSSFRRLSCS
jgi:indole-3-glycerol phosphate synthase